MTPEEVIIQCRLDAYKRPSARFVHEVMPVLWVALILACGGVMLYHFVTRG